MKKSGKGYNVDSFDTLSANASPMSHSLLMHADVGNNREKDTAVRISFIFFCSLLLVACSDPHDTRVPVDISKWSTTVKPSLQKLTLEEQELFTQYVRRHTIVAAEVGLYGDKADPIPEGMTIGKAIAEQRNYVALQQVKKSREKASKDNSEK
jgi:hypothetical protein